MIESRITSQYLHSLQAAYLEINDRGLRISRPRLKSVRQHVEAEINRNLSVVSNQWNMKFYIGTDNNPNLGIKAGSPQYVDAYNLRSTSGDKSLLNVLKNLGYIIPKISRRDREGNYETVYSTNELTLQRMLRDNQFNHPTGDPALRAILNIRELTKLRDSYLNARLFTKRNGEPYFLTNYNVAGTLTGRRASKQHSYHYGNNAQNFPKHGGTAKLYRDCIVPSSDRNVFLMVDQKSAEEWPVSALAESLEAIQQMSEGINRHIKRGSFIFEIPELSRTEAEWKDSIEYYLGKKTGHANNYGMKENRMSESLIQEGRYVAVAACKAMLTRLNMLEPQIDAVFHEYVRKTLIETKQLSTPFGRERQFLGLRPNDNNVKVFNEAYAWIPQSTVGDNTGFAVATLSEGSFWPYVVQENHDSIIMDLPRQPMLLLDGLHEMEEAFNRRIRFHNGIEVQIPIEAELGTSFANTVKIKTHDMAGIVAALEKLKEKEISQNAEYATSIV